MYCTWISSEYCKEALVHCFWFTLTIIYRSKNHVMSLPTKKKTSRSNIYIRHFHCGREIINLPSSCGMPFLSIELIIFESPMSLIAQHTIGHWCVKSSQLTVIHYSKSLMSSSKKHCLCLLSLTHPCRCKRNELEQLHLQITKSIWKKSKLRSQAGKTSYSYFW